MNELEFTPEERLNEIVPIESLYRNALLEIKRLEKKLALRDGENTSLLSEVKYLHHELSFINKRDYENKHIKYKEEITRLNQAIAKYKAENMCLKDEIVKLKELKQQQDRQIENFNLEILKKYS